MLIEDVSSTIYTQSNGVYYAKVELKGLGMYISGVTVRKSPKFGGWWVQMPSYVSRGKYKKYIEFEKRSELWTKIEEVCIEALEEYLEEDSSANNPVQINDEEDGPIGLDDIPF